MLGRLDRRPAARPNPKISSLAGKLTERLKGPVQEQIWELQKKIQLLEGDKKAYFESSQWTIKKNKETILYLRNNNMKLHKELTDMLAGEKVVEEAFQDRDDETILLRSKNGKVRNNIGMIPPKTAHNVVPRSTAVCGDVAGSNWLQSSTHKTNSQFTLQYILFGSQ
uniref:Uncharacterized protein n=1 Tax=Callorhinchus milii TaxID=7868 RepID=A0A4W3H7I6_CALMI